jgi:hypothetical protein
MNMKNVAVAKTEALMKNDLDFEELGLSQNQANELLILQKGLSQASLIKVEIDKKLNAEKERIRKKEVEAGIPELKAMKNMMAKKITSIQNEIHGATKVALANVPGEGIDDKLRYLSNQKALGGRS